MSSELYVIYKMVTMTIPWIILTSPNHPYFYILGLTACLWSGWNQVLQFWCADWPWCIL